MLVVLNRVAILFASMAHAFSSPFLRWAGSKRQLIPILTAHSPVAFERYVEPFAGSACLFFKMRPKRALLGDINAELIRTYLEVKWRIEDLLTALRSLKKSKAQYLELRAMNPAALQPTVRAARFIYLNRCCFNGIYRTNQQGQFNVPYGGERSGEIPSDELLRTCSRALRGATLLSTDFKNVLDAVTDGDFVYMDPPFSVRARRTFREYDATLFGDEQIRNLRQRLEGFAARRIPFLVSYASSDEADFLREGFRSRHVSVRRNISGFANTRKISSEVLIYPEYMHATGTN